MSDFIFETDILEAGDLIGFYFYITQEFKETLAMVLNPGVEIKTFDIITAIRLDNLTVFQMYRANFHFDKLKFYFENKKGGKLVYINEF